MSRGKTELELPRLPDARDETGKTLPLRIEEALKKLGAEEDYRLKTLEALGMYARKERARILGHAEKELIAFRAKERESRKKYGVWCAQQKVARQAELVRYAEQLGINTDEMFRLNAYVRTRADLLMQAPGREFLHPLRSQPRGDSFDSNCATTNPPYTGVFSTSYDRVTGDGRLKESVSSLNAATAVSGGAVRIKNWDADDSDTGVAYQENGFLTCYNTGDQPGLIKITTTLQVVDSEFKLDTYDEWGWSDSVINVVASVRFGMFLHGLGDLSFVGRRLYSTYYSGDGDREHPPWAPSGFIPTTGAEITVSTIFPEVAPANSTVGIYVGTRHAVDFWVNDVSVDARCAGRWLVKEIEMCQM